MCLLLLLQKDYTQALPCCLAYFNSPNKLWALSKNLSAPLWLPKRNFPVCYTCGGGLMYTWRTRGGPESDSEESNWLLVVLAVDFRPRWRHLLRASQPIGLLVDRTQPSALLF